MRRVLISAALVLAVGAFVVIATGASGGGSAQGTYKIELDNAFGLVPGSAFKVAGVPAGKLQSLDLDQNTLHAVATVQVTQSGFGQFHSDAFCQSRPQSLIGEYFIDCQPGQFGKVLKPGSTIPVSHTESTIPGDLLQNVMQMPYRERFTLIINELGAAVASRSEDLQTALQRAVPALTETDNLLDLLANDSGTIQQLNVNADAVVTALANNSANVQRFITEANNAATDTATQQANLQATWQKLPAFLEELRPAMAQLGAAADANDPVLSNLNAASGSLTRFFHDVVPFSHASLPALQSLGQASVTGKTAVEAAGPTIADLNRFSQPTPELAQNLSIVLRDLDNRNRAVERDPRSPGGQGYTGLEALLQYVFNQTLAINTFGPFGHQLSVDAFVSAACSPYATQQSIATNLKSLGAATTRGCYSWLGPKQPGINITDPSNPGACVPDPGGHPAYGGGASDGACKLAASDTAAAADTQTSGQSTQTGNPGGASPSAVSTRAGSSGGGGGSPSSSGSAPAINLNKTLGQIAGGSGTSGGSSGSGSSGGGSGSSSGSGQTQALLNYLLSP